jgi:hypothetical protein
MRLSAKCQNSTERGSKVEKQRCRFRVPVVGAVVSMTRKLVSESGNESIFEREHL